METTNTLHWAASPVKYVGVNDDDTGHNRFHQEPVISFALKYKPAENPAALNREPTHGYSETRQSATART